MTAPAAPVTPDAPAAPVAPPTAPAAPVVPAPPTTPPAAPGAPTDPFAGWDGKIESLPAAAQKVITDLRKENGDTRAAKNVESERVKAILKAAGIETEDDDPVKALETARAAATASAAEARTLRVEIALSNAARTHGADESLLVAVLSHKGEIAKLDPAAADFTQTLDALVKDTVEKNPKLKGSAAPGASGIPGSGGPGPVTDIDAQIAEATKAGNHQLAISLKRQKAYAPRA